MPGICHKSIIVLIATIIAGLQTTAYAQISFNQQIRPLLSRHCTVCHGPDESSREADLRLDQRSAAIADLGGYAAILPGDPDSSELIARISDTDDPMPPEEHGHRLSDDEVELLRAWIREGAVYEQHWSFVKPQRPALPDVDNLQWATSEIDQFILHRQQEHELSPSPPAHPTRLIRRVALDLTGLPPSREQVDRYVSNATLETYEQIVDELLADSAYGEHWASMWLDQARYADTVGYAGDEPRTIWPWRDWVIESFNDNMPFDQFTLDQLAGDLLPDPTRRQRLATAFHRNTLNNNEGGTSDEEFRTVAIKDRLSTTLSTWMGLTARCAECHSHKYDPISHQEYYELLDFFNQTADADLENDSPYLTVYEDHDVVQELVDQQVHDLLVQVMTGELRGRSFVFVAVKLHALASELDEAVRVPVLVELSDGDRRPTHVMLRGNFQNLGDEVQANVPGAFHRLEGILPRDRLALAHWILASENPLTARVIVNRIWARLFGRGIVVTEEDFGTQGSPPSHPQLLDWLAVDFRENGWDVKRLIKQIVMSSTYRQTSRNHREIRAVDPENRWLSRGPRNRLPAETIRDQALAVSGLLSTEMYGEPVFPPNPIKRVVNAFKDASVWNSSTGPDRYRRAIYTFLKRSQPHPLFETFDMSTRDVCSLRRIGTNNPLQSFMTLNAEVFVEAARALAVRMAAADSPHHQIAMGLELALVRPADLEQVHVLQTLYDRSLTEYREQPEDAVELVADPDIPLHEAPQLAALTVVANVILNLDEFLTR
ncbi:MAG: PSD1 and planctomycete cytochrome C domain-containing protein [Pirellulaceae bacterium]